MLSAARQRLARIRRSDAGITLTELVVSMSLLAVVSVLALTSLVGTSSTTNQTTETALSTAAARTAMGSAASLLQVAVVPDPVRPATRNLTITPSSITFNAQLGNLPDCTDFCAANAATKVSFEVRDDGRLVQTLTSGSDTRTTTIVPAGAAKPTTGCVFRAYRLDGSALACTTLAADETTDVGRVEIAFTVTPAVGPVQTFTSSVRLPGGAT